MSSTNKTTNYELSQFIGSDKPAWLADYNQDMSKIDTQMKANSDAANGADGKADANTTSIGTLANLTTTSKINLVSAVNEVNSTATTAQNTATSAASGVSTINTKLTLDQIKDNLTVTSSLGNVTLNNMKVVHNSDGTIAKIYGTINVENVAGPTADVTINIAGTGLYPSQSINVNGCAMAVLVNTSSRFSSVLVPYTINSNGSITVTQPRYSDTSLISIQFIACLVFVEDFAD